MIARWEALLLHVSTLVMASSGVAVAISRHLLAGDDPFSVVGAPWEPLAKAAHVVAAPFLVFSFGLVARRHVIVRLRDGKQDGRRSGVVLSLLVVTMVLSGYFIQIMTHDGARAALGWSHLGLGATFALLYLGHTRLRARTSAPLGLAEAPHRASRSPGQALTAGTRAAHHSARSSNRR